MSKNKALSERIFKLIDIFKKSIDADTQKTKFPEHLKDEFHELWESIVEDLIRSPGTLIFIKDKSEVKSTQLLIDIIWSNYDVEEVFDKITSGGYSGLLVDIMLEYIERAKRLKPTLISVNPNNLEFQTYFQEAMNAWLFGLNNSSLILCCSILENTLKEILNKFDIDLAYRINKNENLLKGVQSHTFKKLINNAAKENIISFEEKQSAHELRELRNDSIHGLRTVTSEKTFEAIINTKNIIEKLLSENFNC